MKKPILVVDDNEVNRYLAQYTLERAGYPVVTAVDGADALEQARRHRPALVLMDIQMPVLDGYDATRRLKADPELRQVPVVALTSFAMPADRERALRSGCDEHLAKPIDPAELVACIEARWPVWPEITRPGALGA